MRQQGEWGIASYVDELAEELAVLGEDELRDELEEVRSHLREAAAGGAAELAAAIDGLGPPRKLAEEILSERGLGPGGPDLPDAPLWRRTIAFVADVSVALVLLLPTLTALGAILYTRADGSLLFGIVEVGILVALNLAALVWARWYWRGRRPGSGASPSFGLALAGVAHIRVGDVVRAVPASRLPHHPSWMARFRAAAAFAVAALIVGSWGWSMLTSGPLMDTQQAKYRLAEARSGGVFDGGVVASTVSGAYNQVIQSLADGKEPTVPENVDPTVFGVLVERIRSGRVAAVDIGGIEQMSAGDPIENAGDSLHVAPATFTCEVLERLPGGVVQPVRIMVEKRVLYADESSSAMTWVITGVEVSGEPWEEASLTAEDTNGETPADVMERYLAAAKAGDLHAQFALLDPGTGLEFEQWKREFTDPGETLVSYKVGDVLSFSDGGAVVEVSFESRIDGRTVNGDKEGWGVVRVDGVWRIPLMPRQ